MRKEETLGSIAILGILTLFIFLDIMLYSGTSPVAFSVIENTVEPVFPVQAGVLMSPEDEAREKAASIAETPQEESLEVSDQNLLNTLSEMGIGILDSGKDINVVIFLKDQPLYTISREEKAKAGSAIESYASELRSINEKTRILSEEEIMDMGLEEAMRIESSALTPEDKARKSALMASIDSELQQVNIRTLEATEAREGPEKDKVKAAVERCGGTVTGSGRIINSVYAVMPEKCLLELNKLGAVAGVYENRISNASLDISIPSMKANTVHSYGYAGGAWDAAVIDTGVDSSHPNLVVDYAKSFQPSWFEKLFLDYQDSGGTDDEVGHGTHCAGIVESSHATYKGVAYGLDKFINGKAGWKTSGGGSMLDDDMMDAVDWAIYTGGADVISYSFGSSHSSSDDCSSCRFMDAVVDSLDVPVSISAGNDGPGDNTVGTPAMAYNAFSVASVYDGSNTNRNNDVISSYSSRGYTAGGRVKPDIAAPGQYIYSANYRWESENDFLSMSGTSMAAPHIAGAVVLVLDFAGVKNPNYIRALLFNTAENNGTFTDKRAFGWGYVDMAHAYAHRSNVFTGTIGENGDYRLYKGHMDNGEKATLVWNRHVSYDGSSYPGNYYSLNDLDIYLYNENTGGYLGSSISSIENVEQVKASSSVDVVIKVRSYTSNFYHPSDSEEFALATEEGFVSTTKPSLSAALNYTSLVYDSQMPIVVQANISNSGGTRANSVTSTLAIPAGLVLVSGTNPQGIPSISGGGKQVATWRLNTSVIGTYSGFSASFSSSSYGFSESGSTGSASITIQDDDTAGPSLLLWTHPSSIYGNSNVSVSVTTKDSSGVKSGLLYYDITGDGVTDGSIAMTVGSNSLYTTISAPGKSYETKNVSFYITAEDNDSDRPGDSMQSNSSRRYILIVDDDTTPPSYSNWIYTNPGSPTIDIPVSLKITDSSGVAYARLYYDYSADGSIDGIVNMTYGGGRWSGTIPAPGSPVDVRFIVESEDSDTDRAGDSLRINSSWQNLTTADDDTENPSFESFDYPNSVFGDEDVSVIANITDDSGVANARLYYDYGNDGSNDGSVVMSGAGASWSGNIPYPGKSYETKQVGFFIEAEDADTDGPLDSLKSNSSKQVYQIIDDDTESPVFEMIHFSASVYGVTDSIVNVTINDSSGINYSKLHYDLGVDGEDGLVSMVKNGNSYVGTLSAFGNANEERSVQFFIEAADNDDDRVGDILKANSTVVQFTILDDDVSAPEFSGVNYPTQVYGDGSAGINVSVTDPSGISQAKAFYDNDGDGDFDSSVSLSSGSGWSGSIPAPGKAFEGKNITFLIEASDDDDDRSGDSISRNSSEYLISILDDDVAAPSFNDWGYETMSEPDESINVSVNVTDNSGIGYARAYYDYGDDGSIDGSVLMVADGDIWNATIPAPGFAYQNKSVLMIVEAEDDDDDIAGDSIRINSTEKYVLVTDPIPTAMIHSPVQAKTYTGNVSINITTSEPVVLMNLSNDSGEFTTVCNSCDSYTAEVNMSEGMHSIDVLVLDSALKPGEASSYFTVDLTQPVVHSYNLPDGKVTKDVSAIFTVNYSEKFLKGVTLVILPGDRTELVECSSGDFKTCSLTKDISGYPHGSVLEYYFIVNETSGRNATLFAAGDPYTLIIDRQSPILSFNSPSNNSIVGYMFRLNISSDESAWVNYSLDGGSNVSIASGSTGALQDFSNLSIGQHKIIVWSVDAIGNIGSSELLFEIASDFDKDGLYDGTDADDDGDGLLDASDPVLGNISDISTNMPSLVLEINDSADINKTFTGAYGVVFRDGSSVIAEFSYNFSSLLNLGNVFVKKQDSPGNGAVLIRGIDLGDSTKSVFVDDLNPSTEQLCIKDAEVLSLSEISGGCNAGDEILLTCPGNASGFVCSLNGSRYRVDGLHHSAVQEFIAASSASSGGGGGGSGGSGSIIDIVPTSDGVIVALGKSDRARIKFDVGTHTLKVSGIGMTGSVLLIDGKEHAFGIFSQSKDIDLDIDGKYDITIKMEGVSSQKVVLLIRKYSAHQKPSWMAGLLAPNKRQTTPAVGTTTAETRVVEDKKEIPFETATVSAPVSEKPAEVGTKSTKSQTIGIVTALLILTIVAYILISTISAVRARRKEIPPGPLDQIPKILDRKDIDIKFSKEIEEPILPRRAKEKDQSIYAINDEIKKLKEDLKR